MTDALPDNPAATEPAEAACADEHSLAGGGRYWGLVPCAGSGSRAGGEMPKQYQLVDGMALVQHTMKAFAAVARIACTLVVLAPGDTRFASLAGAGTPACASRACGAATRAGTVANGLLALRAMGARGGDWVLVHDAARCLVTPELIDRLIDACCADAVGGLLAVPVSDTVKLASCGRVAATVDRSVHWLAQTPQMFRLAQLQQALGQAGDGMTDESSAIERMGISPLLVMGDVANFKVTHPPDLLIAQAVLRARRELRQQELLHEHR